MSTVSAITLTGSAPSADPSAIAIGLANTAIISADTRSVSNATVTMVGATESISKSARIRHDPTPNSARSKQWY